MFPFIKQTKKKLVGLTKEHEALFNFVESNKHISTIKEKQKVRRNIADKLFFTATCCMYFHLGVNISWKSCQLKMCSLLQMLNRLTKSAETQARVDEEYFKINMEGHQMRLKLENTLKNCYQVQRDALLLVICVPLYPEWLFVSEEVGSVSCLRTPHRVIIRVEKASFCPLEHQFIILQSYPATSFTLYSLRRVSTE